MGNRLLVVSDMPAQLELMQKSLLALGPDWETVSAGSVSEALEIVSQEPSVDILVADLFEPSADGVLLLTEVGDKHPHILRLIIADGSDRNQLVNCVMGSHQFLSKPCEPSTLLAAIQRSVNLSSLLKSARLKKLAAQVRSFPTIPSLYLEVMKLLRSPNTSTDELGEALARDMSMTTKILHVINSAFYGLPREITDLKEAVGLLGLQTINSLVLGIQLYSQFDKIKPLYFSIDRLWKHSTAVAQTALKIIKVEQSESGQAQLTFTAGLLHDVGQLILANNFEEQYDGVRRLVGKTGMSQVDLEQEIFGASHAELGAYLLGLWGLPFEVVEAVAYHHTPDKSPNHHFGVLTALHVANALEAESQKDQAVPQSPVDENYLDGLGLLHRLTEWRELAGQTPAPKPVPKPAPPATEPSESAPPPKAGAMDLPNLRLESPGQVKDARWHLIFLPLLLVTAALAWFYWPARPTVENQPAGASKSPLKLKRPASAVAPTQKSTTSGQAVSLVVSNAAAATNVAATSTNGGPPGANTASTNLQVAAPATNQAIPAAPLPPATPARIASSVRDPSPGTGNVAAVDPVSRVAAPASGPAVAPAISRATPPPLKLQAIMYNRNNPRAIINGQIVGRGEKVDGIVILAINPAQVVYEYAGQRQVLVREAR